jgi:ATP-dependent DNA helicase RecQ
MITTVERARAELREHWGYEDFRGGQARAIEAVLAGRDSLTVMPTGGGKSLCYQVPALLLPGVTLVVSPLISLMKDQVDALQRIGLPATFVNSTLGAEEIADRLDAAARGEIKLVYLAPERFDSGRFRDRLAGLDVSLLAVDEAHCISEWGHDFRPAYRRMGRLREMVGDPPVAALTATATAEVREDIVRQLALRDPQVLVTGFDRRNLLWRVTPAENDSERDRTLVRLVKDQPEGSVVVYASTRKNVEALSALLNGVGVPAVGYHGGLPPADRKRLQESFMTGEVRVVVATNAFGMGIDKADVRAVLHYNMPGSLEAYYQEAGRAGRDGRPAECILLHRYADRFTHEFFIDCSHPPREVVEKAYRELRSRAGAEGEIGMAPEDLVTTLGTPKGNGQATSALRVLADAGAIAMSRGDGAELRVTLLARPERIRQEMDAEQRAPELRLLRAVWRLGGGERAYRGATVSWRDLARTVGPDANLRRLLDRLQGESFLAWQREGACVRIAEPGRRGDPRVDWRTLEERRRHDLGKVAAMQGYAYTEECRRRYILRYFGDPEAPDSCGACDVCRGEAVPAKRGGGKRRRERPAKAIAPDRPLRAGEEEVRDRLKQLRSDIARERKIPAFMIFSDRTMRELARTAPSSEEALLQVRGIGPAKAEAYGERILAVIAEE